MADTFSLATETFKGPLEVLLDLIENRKLSISEISLAEVTDAYLAYVESLQQLPMAETAQFIVVASTLLLIKSRSLLPTLEITPEEKESIHDLESRLAQLAIVRRGVKELKNVWGTTPLLFPVRAPLRTVLFSPGTTSLSQIQMALRALVTLLPKPEKLAEASVAPVLKLEEVVASLKQRIQNAWKTQWSDLTRSASRSDTIVYFLAMLELVRSGSASVTQEALFSDIVIEQEGSGTGVPQYGI